MLRYRTHCISRILSLVCGCLMFFLLSPPAAAVTSGELLEGYNEYIKKVMEEWNVPGVSVAIVYDGEVAFLEGFGLRDVDNGLPVTEETLFGIGSSSKAFTAALLMTLVEEGTLDLNQPVREYLPAFALDDMVTENLVTAKDLLSHRAGLPRYDMTFMFNPEVGREEFLRNIRHMRPIKDLRSTFHYSNHGYTVAGILYEEITGHSWEEGIQERIFHPLGMSGSNMSVREMFDLPDFSRGYYLEDDMLQEVPYWEFEAAAPAGAINTHAADMSRWLLASLGGAPEPGDSPLLSEASFQALYSPVMPILGRMSSYVSHLSYGLGWMVESYRGYYHVHHGGVTPGYSAMVSLFPDEGIGVAVVCNLSGSPLPTILAREAVDRLLGLEPVDWNAFTKEADAASEEVMKTLSVLDRATRKLDTSPSHPLDAYTGTFQHPLYGTFQFTTTGKQLTATYHQAAIPLEHWHFDVFTGWVEYFMPLQLAFHFVTDIYGDLNEVKVDLDPFSVENPVTFTRRLDQEKPATELFSRLSGEYLVMGTPIAIHFTEEEKLIMSIPEQPDWLLEPIGGLHFRIRGLPGYEVRFTLGENGAENDLITLVQPQGNFSGKRVQ